MDSFSKASIALCGMVLALSKSGVEIQTWRRRRRSFIRNHERARRPPKGFASHFYGFLFQIKHPPNKTSHHPPPRWIYSNRPLTKARRLLVLIPVSSKQPGVFAATLCLPTAPQRHPIRRWSRSQQSALAAKPPAVRAHAGQPLTNARPLAPAGHRRSRSRLHPIPTTRTTSTLRPSLPPVCFRILPWQPATIADIPSLVL